MSLKGPDSGADRKIKQKATKVPTCRLYLHTTTAAADKQEEGAIKREEPVEKRQQRGNSYYVSKAECVVERCWGIDGAADPPARTECSDCKSGRRRVLGQHQSLLKHGRRTLQYASSSIRHLLSTELTILRSNIMCSLAR